MIDVQFISDSAQVACEKQSSNQRADGGQGGGQNSGSLLRGLLDTQLSRHGQSARLANSVTKVLREFCSTHYGVRSKT